MPLFTRREFIGTAAAALAADWRRRPPRARPTPSAAQLAWQRDELALFTHFGINTFTDREWGDGREDPAIFAPARLDVKQWARSARAAGFRAMILTAKHHDGFCLWPTRTTRHSVAASPWRAGQGDLVDEFVQACRTEGIKPGLYLSPWDRHEPSYGDSPRYNDFYCDQLTELLTQYGSIHEVWFDGANGEGPNGKKQTYDWPRVWALVRRLQPEAVMFSDAGPDVRWIGNENGSAGETNWSTVDPAVVPVPGVSGPAVRRMLQEGDPNGTVWRPGESDVSIRPGWFHHPAEDGRVKSADDLVRLYFTSVGRNSKLLLNVPPTRDGLLHDADVASLAAMHTRLFGLFSENLAYRGVMKQRPTGLRSMVAEADLGGVAKVSMIAMREDIEHGQVVARYRLEGELDGAWRPLAQGTTIGCRKIDRFEPVSIRKVRLVVDETIDLTRPVELGVYA